MKKEYLEPSFELLRFSFGELLTETPHSNPEGGSSYGDLDGDETGEEIGW